MILIPEPIANLKSITEPIPESIPTPEPDPESAPVTILNQKIQQFWETASESARNSFRKRNRNRVGPIPSSNYQFIHNISHLIPYILQPELPLCSCLRVD